MKNIFRNIALSLSSVAIVCTSTMAAAQDRVALLTAADASVMQDFAKFIPQNQSEKITLDYAIWDEALGFFVLNMGKSLRQSSSRPEATTGSRRSYGHDFIYRLEGNRVIFSLLEDDIITSLTQYRQDLEQIGSEINIATMPRNEQLAYWTNLHNVAMIEQIALAYPVRQPARLEVGEAKSLLDETRFITVAGVKLSPKDIRTKIVYPNWRDSKVLYGFFRGDIGSPSISRRAYTGANVNRELTESS